MLPFFPPTLLLQVFFLFFACMTPIPHHISLIFPPTSSLPFPSAVRGIFPCSRTSTPLFPSPTTYLLLRFSHFYIPHCTFPVPSSPSCFQSLFIHHPASFSLPLVLSIHLWVSGGGLITDGNGSTPEQIDVGRPSLLRAASPSLVSPCLLSACQPDKPAKKRKEGKRAGETDGGLDREDKVQYIEGKKGCKKVRWHSSSSQGDNLIIKNTFLVCLFDS